MQRILLKTTIPYDADDWHIGRFSLLANFLRSFGDGTPRFIVDTSDRLEDERGNDPDLVHIAQSDYQQLWLFGVEQDGGLSFADLMGINVFRQQGGGLMLCRGPGDMGSSMYLLSTVGAAQCFNTVNPETDPDRRCADLAGEDWPCYNAGAEGDAQEIQAIAPTHPLLRRPDGSAIRFLPASSREGAVEVPESTEDFARVIATGTTCDSRRAFNIAVAFERHRDRWGELTGRAVAEASFLRFADYALDPVRGCPSSLSQSAGEGIAASPRALADTQAYYRNIALWLAG